VHAFTLVELLVVIAIVSLLMAVLLPVLRESRAVARQVKCASNLRQIGVAMMAYGVESHDSVVLAAKQDAANQFQISWDDAIASMLGHDRSVAQIAAATLPAGEGSPLLICPDDPMPAVEPVDEIRTYAMAGMNADDTGSPGPRGMAHRVNLAAAVVYRKKPFHWSVDVPSPSSTLLVTEFASSFLSRNKQGSGLNERCWVGLASRQTSELWSEPIHFRSGDRLFEYLLADGSARAMVPEQTVGAGGVLSNPLGAWTREPGD